MKILVTGGTGVIGAGLIPALLQGGHQLRILSRGAEKDSREWPDGVEPFPADIRNPTELRNAATDCEAIVHVTGIVDEMGPETTFESINVAGTINVLAEAERALVNRFIYISSLGADTGQSPYHRSKAKAEDAVRLYSREWVILRPGNVYGPGDDVISAVLKMVRSLPVIPIVAAGDQRFQPVWFEDIGLAIAATIERPDVAGHTLALAGDDVTSATDLIDRFAKITDRKPWQVSVPASLASLSTQAAGLFSGAGGSLLRAMGFRLPLNQSKLTMLLEESIIHEPDGNALPSLLGTSPTPLDVGLRRLADELPELVPADGFGSMERKRFWADIELSKMSHIAMMTLFKERVNDVMPLEFATEPHTPTRIEQGITLTANIPMRGNIQVRVEVCGEDRVTLATVEGHPLAGIVTFRTEQLESAVRFVVEIYERASNLFDWFAMHTVGRLLQNGNWGQVVERMVQVSGGEAVKGVQSAKETLSESDSTDIEQWIDRMIGARKRVEREESLSM